MQYERGTFLRWQSEDDKGSFDVVGQVASHKNGMVAFNLEQGGQYNIPEDDGTFTVISKPRNWAQPDISTEIPTKTKRAPVKRAPRVKGGPTKADQVKDLLQARPELVGKRAAAIEAIMQEVGMSKAGASTYYQNAKKALS